MKARLFTLLLLLPVLFASGQRPQRCDVPLPDHIFKQKQRSVTLQPTEELRLQVAIAIASKNCLSVMQVKSLADHFIDDYSRLEFAKAAWHNTVDQENYYFVYDAFAYFSTVFMLHDYVQTMDSRPVDYLPPYEPPLSLNFPALDYPAFENYRGPSNCNYPIREDDFIRLAGQVSANHAEPNRLVLLTQMAQNNCLSVAQAMKLSSMLQSEPNRLTFFRTAISTIYDLGNLQFGAQMFAHIPNKAAYNEMISRPTPAPQPIGPVQCFVSDEEFSQITNSIKKESFNSTKVTLTKQILRSKQCFTVNQVKEITRLFSFDDSRLEIAKYAWDYTIDRDNYYQVADVFSFSSSKENLMKFLEGK
ncbi:MAG: hypothetical protein FD170_165 [Bacteroidetes bacterium]|nr:MAG: hypothetical protein FD170_165 [Bacteroidota bacterium]